MTLQRSPELIAVARRFFKAVMEKDSDALTALTSSSAATSIFGTADGEFWQGEHLRDLIGEHYREAPSFRSEEIMIDAYENGSTGWAFYMRDMQAPGRTDKTIFRVTLIFVLEAGAWKIVHRHASQPRPNTELHGGSHTALDKLITAAREENAFKTLTGIHSVLFTDIADSSTLNQMLGDAVWTSLVTDHFAMIEDVATAHDGQVIKSMGDGTMSVFPSAGQAMRAALALRNKTNSVDVEPRLAIRIGLHTGDTVSRDGDFFGTVVNKAARISAMARPGEIRVSDESRIMVGADPALSFNDRIEVELKGLGGQHLLYRLESTDL